MKTIYDPLFRLAIVKANLKKISLLFIMYLLLQANYSYSQWTRKADALRKRGECPSVLYKGKIYVFGGFGEHPNIEKDNEVYNPALNKWTLIASFPAGKEVTHQGVVLIDDKIWHIGGREVNNRGPISSQVIIYDITNNSWKNGPQLRDPATGQALPLGAGGAALLGRTLHVFGGFGANTCTDQNKYHLTLDIDKWLANPSGTSWQNKSAPMPTPRNHLSTAVLGGKIYALGGQFGHDCKSSDQKYCHVYDAVANKWTRLTDLPSRLSHTEPATFPLDGKIYLVGGQGLYDAAKNTVLVFTPTANGGLGSWSNATQYKLPNLYFGISSKVVGNSFIISHGAQSNIKNERRETYTAPITRSIPYKFGFATSCFSQTLNTNQKAIVKNFLYTIEGQKQYSLTSSAGWLKITKNATGTAIQSAVNIEATIDATGLRAGSYSATITANGTGTGQSYTSASFCVNLTVRSATSLITNVTSLTGRSYILGKLAVGTAVYSDRAYQVTAVPAFLNEAPFIKTPNDDKANKATEALSFNLTQNATVYIGYDPRATTLPAWMSGWQKLTERVNINDPGTSYMVLYSKSYLAGKVTLGGNLASPAAGAQSQYCVIAKAQQAQSRIVATPDQGTKAESQEKLFSVNPDQIKATSDVSETNRDKRFISSSSMKYNKAYPNPFIESTKIYYSLKNKANVILSINTMQGQQVQLLVNGLKEAGDYQATFNAGKYASGMYIYRLQIGNEVKVGKVVKQ